jgi:hypothetical protein
MTRIEELSPEYLRGLPVYVPGRPIEEVMCRRGSTER